MRCFILQGVRRSQSLTPEKELYERLIAELREEVSFLRGLLKK